MSVHVRLRPSEAYDPQTFRHYDRNVILRQPGRGNESSFVVDSVHHNSEQREVFEPTCASVLSSALNGVSGTVLAFGPSGAGKTYSMMGPGDFGHRGICPLMVSELFKQINDRAERNYVIKASYLEIKNEHITDLLASKVDECGRLVHVHLRPYESQSGDLILRNVIERLVTTEQDCLETYFRGSSLLADRHAHGVFSLSIESSSRSEANGRVVCSRIDLVDLAGSERGSQSGFESVSTNRSIVALEQVVSAMRAGCHIPFRQSKLTHCLKRTLQSGNISLLVCISPECSQFAEAYAALKFASRLRALRGSAISVPILTDAQQIAALRLEVRQLKKELALHDQLKGKQETKHEPLTEAELADITVSAKQFMAGVVEEVDVQSERQIQAVLKAMRKLYNDAKFETQRAASPTPSASQAPVSTHPTVIPAPASPSVVAKPVQNATLDPSILIAPENSRPSENIRPSTNTLPKRLFETSVIAAMVEENEQRQAVIAQRAFRQFKETESGMAFDAKIKDLVSQIAELKPNMRILKDKINGLMDPSSSLNTTIQLDGCEVDSAEELATLAQGYRSSKAELDRLHLALREEKRMLLEEFNSWAAERGVLMPKDSKPYKAEAEQEKSWLQTAGPSAVAFYSAKKQSNTKLETITC